MLSKNSYKECIKYIENYWDKITYYLPKNKGTHIGLPNPFIAPNSAIFKNDQFYWDSYFIILGLIASGKVELAKGMVDNFVYLYKRFNIIPSSNRLYNLGISQIPFLTSMIIEVYNIKNNKTWLKEIVPAAEAELKKYWQNNNHLACQGLSRYCDHFIVHWTAEHESGWDMTSRFHDKCLDYLSIDLNSCLYKYEIDLAEFYNILGNKAKERYFLNCASKRKKKIIKLMWDNKKGFFFDYNYQLKRQSNFYSLAGFYPLWAKLATKQQAEECGDKLKRFEYKGGLANTQKAGLSKVFKQWDYPNGWANQQWIVIRGLLNYDFKEDAERIAYKWMETNKQVFKKTGKFWEKYNVVKSNIGKEGRYLNQIGFGWTNAIFVKLINEFCRK